MRLAILATALLLAPAAAAQRPPPPPPPPPAPAAPPRPALPAPTPGQQAALAELFEAMDAENQMREAYRLGLESALLEEQNMAMFGDLIAELGERVLVFEELAPSLMAIYANRYTEDEIRQLTALYRSPAGQLLLREAAPISADTNTLVQRRVQEQTPWLMEQMMRRFGLDDAGPAPRPGSKLPVK